MATSTFAAKITDLVGGTIDDNACDDWMTEGAKEIINQLPGNLKAKCAAATTLNNSTTVMDMDAVGEILFVTRDSADSGGFQVSCREIPAQYGGLATDSTDLNYFGSATDPVYWIDGNTSDAVTLYVKPTPTADQTAIVHHIVYPTVDNGTDNIIANFPDEAEYLVVLYAATRQLLQYQNTMTTSWNSEITQALNNAKDVINNNSPSATTDAYGALNNEDIEIMSASLSLAGQQLGEASSRLQLDSAKYQWYGDQYAKLTAEYARGLAALKGS